MTKKKFFLLGLFTILFFPLVSFVIHLFTKDFPFYIIFKSNSFIITELILGFLTGGLIALLGWEILNANYLKSELTKYSLLFSPDNLTYPLIIFVSLCAGIGEEIFFRGIIQPYLGIVVTAIIFVAIHGYLNPKNLKITVYGVYMVFAIMLLGYLTDKFGLITAITAHTVIDVVLLIKTKKMLARSNL